MIPTLFTLPRFLPSPMCARVIADAERRGFEDAPVTTGRGFVMMPELRSNTRVIVDDPALAAGLWTQMERHVPPRSDPWRAIGLNERFRIYRYDPGQAFRWHRDGAFVRSEREQSFLTVLIYLNGGFEGGATELEEATVTPEEGLALVFTHSLRHQGAAVTSGRKYVLRSDVMFTR